MLWLCFEADLFDTFRIAFPAVTSENFHYIVIEIHNISGIVQNILLTCLHRSAATRTVFFNTLTRNTTCSHESVQRHGLEHVSEN